MNPVVLYCYPIVSADYDAVARRFVDTYKRFPAGVDHSLVVVCNNGPASSFQKALFAGTNPVFIDRHNEGWDIGAFIEGCRSIMASGLKPKFVMCCGANTHFKRSGWLARMNEAWDKHGPGMYGATASFEVRPHFNTSSFVADVADVANYPFHVSTTQDRYHFEWGARSLMNSIAAQGRPTLLVTWDGEYPPPLFRSAPNGYRNGDQSNCLAYFRHSDTYDNEPAPTKHNLASYADGVRNNSPEVIRLRNTVDSMYGS